MNRARAQELLPIITAFAQGLDIQNRSIHSDDDWDFETNPTWRSDKNYRIAPGQDNSLSVAAAAAVIHDPRQKPVPDHQLGDLFYYYNAKNTVKVCVFEDKKFYPEDASNFLGWV